jgi:hypothetical protein
MADHLSAMISIGSRLSFRTRLESGVKNSDAFLVLLFRGFSQREGLVIGLQPTMQFVRTYGHRFEETDLTYQVGGVEATRESRGRYSSNLGERRARDGPRPVPFRRAGCDSSGESRHVHLLTRAVSFLLGANRALRRRAPATASLLHLRPRISRANRRQRP